MSKTAMRKASESPANAKGEIVVYQPDETMRLEVRHDGETVWLTQLQMSELFGRTVRNVRMHLANVYACGELDENATLCGASVKDAGHRMFALVKMATSPDFILKDLPVSGKENRRLDGALSGRKVR